MPFGNSPTTDERLRSGLDANQAVREQMCIALLPLLGKYTFARPRRPRGGPDGGRDIEALFDDRLTVWGAVGFQNGANDSAEQKKWVHKKFGNDLSAAIKNSSALRGFVFFTNVDLTPGEQSKLRKLATTRKLTHVEIFGREQLRHVLDSTEGLGYRLRYLGLSMSPEEQLQFVSRFEQTIGLALDKHREFFEERMRRLEFLQMASEPIHSVSALCILKDIVPAISLGHFRVFLQLSAIRDGYISSLSLIARDRKNFGQLPSEIRARFNNRLGIESCIWSENEKNRIAPAHDFNLIRGPTVTDIDFGVDEIDQPHSFSLRQLNRRAFSLYMTEPLAERIRAVNIIVNCHGARKTGQLRARQNRPF